MLLLLSKHKRKKWSYDILGSSRVGKCETKKTYIGTYGAMKQSNKIKRGMKKTKLYYSNEKGSIGGFFKSKHFFLARKRQIENVYWPSMVTGTVNTGSMLVTPSDGGLVESVQTHHGKRGKGENISYICFSGRRCISKLKLNLTCPCNVFSRLQKPLRVSWGRSGGLRSLGRNDRPSGISEAYGSGSNRQKWSFTSGTRARVSGCITYPDIPFHGESSWCKIQSVR